MFNSIRQLKKLISLIDNNDISTLRSIFESQVTKIIKEDEKRKKKVRKRLEISVASKQNLREIAEDFRKKLVANQTESEKLTKAILKSMELEYIFQKIIYYKDGKKESFYIVDFYIPKYNIGIEIDGEYHKYQKSADRKRTKMLKDLGLKGILRFYNEDVKIPDYISRNILKSSYVKDYNIIK